MHDTKDILAAALAVFVALAVILFAGTAIAFRPDPVTIQDTVVRISLESGHGSGTVIDAERGLILTAGHVAEVGKNDNNGTMNIETTDGCKEFAHVLWIGEKDDVAIMQASGNCKLHAAHVRASALKAGDKVFAIGYPLWMGQITTEGRVLNADIKLPGEETAHVMLTDALLAPGNSGGGLFDEYGNLVGVNVAMATFTRGMAVLPSGHMMAVAATTVCNYIACN